MRDQDPRGKRSQQVVVMAIPATGLVTHLETIGQASQEAHHLLDAAHLRTLQDRSGFAEHAKRNVVAVDIEPDIEHRYLPKSEWVRTSMPSSTLPDGQRPPT